MVPTMIQKNEIIILIRDSVASQVQLEIELRNSNNLSQLIEDIQTEEHGGSFKNDIDDKIRLVLGPNEISQCVTDIYNKPKPADCPNSKFGTGNNKRDRCFSDRSYNNRP